MLKDLNIDQTKLMAFMSDISERCFSAGWMENLEFSLWNAILNGPRRYGHGLITTEDIDYLKEQSTICNCWIVFDEINEETAMDLTLWREKYKRDILHDPSVLDY